MHVVADDSLTDRKGTTQPTSPEHRREVFLNPPASCQPWVYWSWQNGNITREGILADLESMHRVGIGGVIIMNVRSPVPEGSVEVFGKEWRELFKYTCDTAVRLGIQINMFNGAGWSGSSVVWMKPEHSMKMLSWSETRVEGGKTVSIGLPLTARNLLFE